MGIAKKKKAGINKAICQFKFASVIARLKKVPAQIVTNTPLRNGASVPTSLPIITKTPAELARDGRNNAQRQPRLFRCPTVKSSEIRR